MTHHPSGSDRANSDDTPAAAPSRATALNTENRPSDAVSTTVIIGRVVLIVTALLLLVFYLGPRIYGLVVTPSRLDQAVESAGNYNPALDEIVAQEKRTSAALGSLGSMNAALESVLATDSAVSGELGALTAQINDDISATLGSADQNVGELVSSLDSLTTTVRGLNDPVDRADGALSSNIDSMTAILDTVRITAADVHSARLSAEESANDLSGQ
ncbi:hypothetical protein [Rhodococcus sp. EPR-157]|uniref:hypothetical protein n=1 Tax=Rhodococcus sp. EPR-157 TaxID=1813677 RepID=UPI001E53CEC4|nr:hypothetical protein [Rhodococcus sp. EPR-157]